MAKKLPYSITVQLPKIIVNLHTHGRDLQQRHKTTVEIMLRESREGLISISGFMPNTKPAITGISQAELYVDLIDKAKKNLKITEDQYLFFGVTDYNLLMCERALQMKEVLGLKVYPAKNGKVATTGSDIGASLDGTILAAIEMATRYGKVCVFHCEDMEIAEKENFSKRAEAQYVARVLKLASMVKGCRIVIAHVSCKASACLILEAQKKGTQAMIELAPQYLWFDSLGHNWRKDLSPEFYACLNRLRTVKDRLFLNDLAWSDNPLVCVHSDSACHTEQEKKEGASGIPSHKHLVPVVVTTAAMRNASEKRIAQLLNHNAANFFNLSISDELVPRNFELRKDRTIYNDGKVINPWVGSRLYFPMS